jgi:hypothetical protein
MSDTGFTSPPAPRLALRIGVAGHRINRLLAADADLAAVEQCAQALLREIAGAAEQLRVEQGEVYRDTRPLLRLISSLAEGTDQIVAAIAAREGYTIDVLLPGDADGYASYFQTPVGPTSYEPRDTLAALLENSAVGAVQTLDGAFETEELRTAAYVVAGRALIQHSDVLIAVWDGSRARGPGGTADVVAQALRLDIPVLVIDPRSPASWHLFTVPSDQVESDTIAVGFAAGSVLGSSALLLDILRKLLEAPPVIVGDDDELAEPIRPYEPDTQRAVVRPKAISPLAEYLRTRPGPAIGGFFNMIVRGIALERPSMPKFLPRARQYVSNTIEEWRGIWKTPAPLPETLTQPIERGILPYYAWADGLADRYGALHRDVFSWMYVFALAAALAALGVHFGAVVMPHKDPVIWVRLAVIEFGILGFILIMYWLANRGRYHRRWIDYRSLAEQLRTLIFLWPLGRPVRTLQFHGESVTEAPHVTWIDWYHRAVIRELGLFPGRMSREHFAACQRLLADHVLAAQAKYHRHLAHRMHRVHHVIHTGATLLFVVAAVGSLYHLWHLWHDGFLSYSYLVLGNLDESSQYGVSARAAMNHVGGFGVVAVFLPTLAATMHGFLSQGDFENVRRRSKRMAAELGTLAPRVAALSPDPVALGDAAEEAARVMSDEVLYWRVFVRLKPISLV